MVQGPRSHCRSQPARGRDANNRKACTKAGVVGVTFNDLRGTAVTRLALAGCTEAEIATITGHSLRDVRSILDAPVNPCERGGRIYRGSRADRIWTEEDQAAFLKTSAAHLHLPLLLALWTGQRQGDLLHLSWSAYDGTHIRLKQSKTGIRVIIPVGTPLKAALDSAAKRSTIILTTADGKPWTPDGFRASWRESQKIPARLLSR